MTRKRRKGESRPPASHPVLGSYRIEVRPIGDGRKSVLVCACEEILAYSHESLSLRHGSEVVTVSGRDLWCRTYSPHSAEVVGEVFEIVLKEREKR